jgi:hypothetical protein
MAQPMKAPQKDTARGKGIPAQTSIDDYPNIWSLDFLISGSGFGFGGVYRRLLSPDISASIGFSISESKDDREIEYIDAFGNSYVPGKLNRFFVVPLHLGVQYRLFREDIVETFRPFVTAGAGPAMIYQAPFVEITTQPGGDPQITEREFFSSLGDGTAHFTASWFVGFGANIGADRSNVLGISFRYQFTYLFSDGLPSFYDPRTLQVVGAKSDFGGFFISLTIGMAN